MTRAQKLIIAVMAVLTIGVFILLAAIVVTRTNTIQPEAQALPAATPTATAAAFTVTATRTLTVTGTVLSTPAATATRTTTAIRPTATLTLLPATAAPTPTPVGILCTGWDMPHSFAFFTDRQDKTHFVGEPRNTGNAARESVLVVIRLFNRQGQYLGATSAPLMRNVIPPAESAPFNAVLEPPAPDWQSYTLEFRCNVPGIATGTPYTDLAVTSDKGQVGSNSTYTVTGEIKNTGKEKAQAVQAIVVLYDVNGWVINAHAVDADPSQVTAGATATFKVDFETVPHPVAKYTVYVQGEVAR
ncbi:MAG: FxLYD domain-containing protein [Anaerolineae bacterium]